MRFFVLQEHTPTKGNDNQLQATAIANHGGKRGRHLVQNIRPERNEMLGQY